MGRKVKKKKKIPRKAAKWPGERSKVRERKVANNGQDRMIVN